MNSLKVIKSDKPVSVDIVEMFKSDLLDHYQQSEYKNIHSFSNYLSSNTDLSYKFFCRIFKNEVSNPGYDSLIMYYQFRLNVETVDLLIEVGPKWLAEHLKNAPEGLVVTKKKGDTTIKSKEASEYLLNNITALKIYLFVSSGKETMESVSIKYGEEGIKEVFKMLKLDISLLRLQDNLITINSRKSLLASSELHCAINRVSVDNFFNHEKIIIKGENIIDSTHLDVSKEAYDQMLEAAIEFRRKINSIVKNDDIKCSSNKSVSQQTAQNHRVFYTVAMDKVKVY